MKRILGTLAISLTSILCAGGPMDNNMGSSPTPSKKLYFTNDEKVTVTPPAGPQTERSWNAFITADFIYWTVREDGMFHAVSGVGTNAPKGSVHDLDWGWDPGFKVGLGFNLAHDGWDLYAQYTWIHSSASDTQTRNPATTTMISYWSIGGAPIAGLERSHAHLDVHFNDVHLELGRNSYLSQYLKMRIHAGLQAAWINQDYDVTQTVNDGTIWRLDQDQDFWGIGLRAGLDTSWQFTQNWSFFADFALAILYGEFDLTRRDRQDANGVVNTLIHTGVSPYTFEPVLSIGAGFRWETWFASGAYHLLFQAGWEEQIWILQNEFIKVPTETDHIGDMVLQGLTVKARFDF